MICFRKILLTICVLLLSTQVKIAVSSGMFFLATDESICYQLKSNFVPKPTKTLLYEEAQTRGICGIKQKILKNYNQENEKEITISNESKICNEALLLWSSSYNKRYNRYGDKNVDQKHYEALLEMVDRNLKCKVTLFQAKSKIKFYEDNNFVDKNLNYITKLLTLPTDH